MKMNRNLNPYIHQDGYRRLGVVKGKWNPQKPAHLLPYILSKGDMYTPEANAPARPAATYLAGTAVLTLASPMAPGSSALECRK